jgi:phosphoribosylamine--glycine ligase
MNILILGSGGREHAFAWKLHQSTNCNQLYIAPGNAGTATVGINLDIDILDFHQIEEIIEEHDINIMVVGPEAPLVEGIWDYFKKNKPELKVIGPSKKGAQLEGSKAFAKEFMAEYDIPTASYIEISAGNIDNGLEYINRHKGPYVLKADGLAAGKGVLILNDPEEAKDELKKMLAGKFGRASEKVVIEEFLDGIEFSVFILTDGSYYTLLPIAKDYKRIGENDTGLNTGGMGAISPVPFVDAELMDKVKKRIILPTLSGLKDRRIAYEGFIFFGLIRVDNEPMVIEYNCRMGDPETEVVLPRLKNDLLELFEALGENELYEIPLQKDHRYASTVVMVSGGYPEQYEKGKVIKGIENVTDSIVFHSGTSQKGSDIITNGGRVLAITSFGDTIEEAVNKSTSTAEKIQYDQKYYRKDIGFDL